MITIINIHKFLRRRTFSLVAIVAALALIATACGSSDEGSEGDDSRVSVVATTTIWGDVVSEIVGDLASVEVLMPIGADPHDFQPSARQAALLEGADLVVANGLGLEASLTAILENATDSGATVLYVADHLDPIAFSDAEPDACEAEAMGEDGHDGHDHDEAHDDGHDHGVCDPHVWMDPVRVQAAVEEIVEALDGIDPDTDWHAAAGPYNDTLAGVFDEMQALLDMVPVDDRKLVTNHDSLGYLADRFGYEVIATVIPGGSTLADPSSQELTELVALIESENVPAIFSETTDTDAVAQALSAELDGTVIVVELYTGSLGGPDSAASTLAQMLVTDALRISDGLTR